MFYCSATELSAKRLNKASNVIEAQKSYAAKKVEVPGLAYRISRPFGIFRVREHSVSPEALSERAKHASLAAGETIGGTSARGKNSTGYAFLYASPGTSNLTIYYVKTLLQIFIRCSGSCRAVPASYPTAVLTDPHALCVGTPVAETLPTGWRAPFCSISGYP